MRGAIGLLRKPGCIGSAASSISSSIPKQGVSPLSAAFSSSSSGGGSGRGRGRGGPTPSQFQQVPNQPENPKSSDGSAVPTQSAAPIPGRGHGRGNPLPSSPFLPSFNTFGRGSAADEGTEEKSMPKQPMFFRRDDGENGGFGDAGDPVKPNFRRPIGEASLPGSMLGAFSGMGRGQPVKGPETVSQPVEEENRHIRRRGRGVGLEEESIAVESVEQRRARPPKLSREDAKNKALNILSGGGDSQGRTESVGDRGGEARKVAVAVAVDEGVGVDGGNVRNRGAFGRNQGNMEADAEEDEEDDFFVGDAADGEKFAKQVGPEMMNMLTEAFEEISHNVLPSVLEDEYLDAMDTNLKIELEPEYVMADFETNPDIDEKPPIPLRDALEKMKPFLMAYEGIRSEEEWTEVVEDTMKSVPLMKEIVDYYAGPDTSNLGWGFDKKCQFMDKLVAGVSQVYK